MKYKKLKAKFPDKKIVKFISTRRDCSLSLKERWVYSALLWRYKGHPVSKARLARWTGVDRTRTLPRILTRLGNLRLVVTVGSKFKCVRPSSELMASFATHVVGVGTAERTELSYNYAVYDTQRDIIDGLVIAADAEGRHTAAKLARRFGVCAKTITAARRRLAAAGGSRPLAGIVASPPVPAAPPSHSVVAHSVPEPAKEPERPDQCASPEEALAARFAEHLKIEAVATKEIARLCRLLRGLSRTELGQIVSALVAKYGTGEGLEDAVYHFILTHTRRYLCGASLERVLADIGDAPRHEDDDLSLVGDAPAEFATAI
jgi:hypothetical protein